MTIKNIYNIFFIVYTGFAKAEFSLSFRHPVNSPVPPAFPPPAWRGRRGSGSKPSRFPCGVASRVARVGRCPAGRLAVRLSGRPPAWQAERPIMRRSGHAGATAMLLPGGYGAMCACECVPRGLVFARGNTGGSFRGVSPPPTRLVASHADCTPGRSGNAGGLTVGKTLEFRIYRRIGDICEERGGCGTLGVKWNLGIEI
jgi:hypothetical protein